MDGEMKLEPVNTKAAWKGPEIDWKKEGLHVLSPSDIKEIEGALAHLKSLGELDFSEIKQEHFPLGAFGNYLRTLPHELRYGRGFVMLRGLPRERLSTDDMARIYFGIGAYIGLPIEQSWQGELLGHVIDVSDLEDRPRAYHKGGAIEMHTDSGDVIGLMCLRTARSGGASRIASTVALHNALLKSRPDLAEAHYKGFHYKRNEPDAEYGNGVLVSPHRIASFSQETGEFSSYFLGGYARGAVRIGKATLTPLEEEAIKELERLAASPEFYLDMDFTDGDIQFINNRTILHGRTDYDEDRDVNHRRHLLRLWLKVPEWHALPPAQVFHTPEDRRLWARQRKRLGELPSRYVASLSQQIAERAKAPA